MLDAPFQPLSRARQVAVMTWFSYGSGNLYRDDECEYNIRFDASGFKACAGPNKSDPYNVGLCARAREAIHHYVPVHRAHYCPARAKSRPGRFSADPRPRTALPPGARARTSSRQRWLSQEDGLHKTGFGPPQAPCAAPVCCQPFFLGPEMPAERALLSRPINEGRPLRRIRHPFESR